MLRFKAKQITYKVGRFNIGGDPISTPTALFGSIFYSNQKGIFKNEKKGEINKDFIEKLIKNQEAIADKCGLIPGIDLILSNNLNMKQNLDFIFDLTDIPIMLDIPTIDLKIEAIQYINEQNLQNRVIYNSLTPESKENEILELEENKISNLILLALETQKWTTNARIDVINDLINKLNSLTSTKFNIFIDTCVIDFTSLGLAMSSMKFLKDKYGHPIGACPHNAVETWRNLIEKFGKIKKYASLVASTIILGSGADFILYGPIEFSNLIFPNVAFIKAAHSQLLFDEGKFAPSGHPVYKIG
ncbi:MAG: hypothetical protein ACTSVY_06450 [Candidatus Helarchaeota archaeon]